MTQSFYSDVSILFLAGALLLLYGTFKAVQNRGHYGQLVLKGALADAGIVIMAMGSASATGSNGALLFFLFQLVVRVTAYASLMLLTPKGAAPTAQELHCIGLIKPKAGWLFSLALLATIGGAPFFAPEGRFFIVQGITASSVFGHVWGPLLMAACSTVFVWLSIEAVQNVILEQPHYLSHDSQPAPAAPTDKLPVWLVALAVVAAFMGIHRGPLADFTAYLTGAPLSHSDVSHLAFRTLYLGAGVVFLLGLANKKPGLRGKATVILMGLALLITIFSGDLSPLSRLFASIICGIGLVVAVYSMGYMAGERRLTAYRTFYLLTFASMLGIVTTDNMGDFYGYWELMTFASFFLVAHEANRTAFNAAAKYYIMCAGGAFVMLPGFILLSGGETTLLYIPAVSSALSPDMLKAALIMTLAGFAVKAGLVPLHSWLPDAHPAAPSSISAPLSGVITKMGIFGIVVIVLGLAGPTSARISSMEGFSGIGYIIAFMGGITLVLGEIMALRQTDIKRMLAYSTIGQLGEITLVLGIGTWLATAAALAHVLNHAIMKDLLFLGAGALILRAGTRNLADMAGMGRAMPFTVTCMGIGLISIMGLPPFAGFFSKYLMIQACINSGHPTLAVFILGGSLVGAIYYTRILRVLVFEPRPAHLPEITGEAPISMRLALGILAAFCLLFGLAPQLPLALVVPAASMYFTPAADALRIVESVSVSWPLYVIVPFFGALIPAIWRNNPKKSGKASVIVLLVTALLVLLFGRELDTLSFSFALIVPLIGALNMAYARGYMDHSHTQWRFYSSFCCICAGLIGVASSSYLFSFFLFWEIMSSWALYMTLAHEGDNASMREAFKYFFFNVLGAAFIFVGVTVLGPDTPLTAALIKDLGVSKLPPLAATAGVALLAVGFVMKAAQLPFRIDWQMHPALAPTPVSGFISSVLLKSSILGLVKLFLLLGGAFALGSTLGVGHEKAIMHIVMWIGGLTIIMASVQALMATNLKLVFIYSTVSQIGYMVLAVGIGSALGYAGGLLHVANHIFFKDLLFLICGAVMFQTHKDNLEELGGIGRKMPVTLCMFAIAGLSVVGVPPTSGFTSKWIIYHALMEQGYAFLALLSLIGSVITLAYIAKFLHLAFLGQVADGLENVQEAPKSMRVPMIILGAGCVLSGVFPGLFLEPVNLVLKEYGLATLDIGPTGINSGPGAWNATAVFIMSALAFYGGWRFVNHFVNANSRATDVHTCGVEPGEATSRMNPASLYAGFAGLFGKKH